MADLGFDVLALDADASHVADLSAGRLPLYETGLEEGLNRGLRSGRLRFTTSHAEAAEFGDVHFFCVGTPQLKGPPGAVRSQASGGADSLPPLLPRPSRT